MRTPAGCPLTEREFELAGMLGEGLNQRQMAARIGRSTSTIRTHLHNAYKRVGAANRVEFLRICYEREWCGAPRNVREREEAVAEEEALVAEWPRITPTQKSYLDAFDRMLSTPAGSYAELAARADMRYFLGGMYREKGRMPAKQAVIVAHELMMPQEGGT